MDNRQQSIGLRTFDRERLCFYLNLLMMTTLCLGYVLSTGLGIFGENSAKNIFRAVAGILSLLTIIVGGRLKPSFLFAIYLAGIALFATGNEVGLNLIFALLMSQSLSALSDRLTSLVFALSSLAAVLAHITALYMGLATAAVTNIGGRLRSTSGFANANQSAMVYFSLVLSAALTHVRFKNKLSLFALFSSLCVAIPYMASSDSRTSIASLVILIAFMTITAATSRIDAASRVFLLGTALTPFLALGISVFLAFCNDSALDYALSYRPYFFGIFMNNLSLTDILFGWPVPPEQGIDNSYLMILSGVGALILAITFLLISRRILTLRVEVTPIVVVILIAGITESVLVRPEIPLGAMLLSIVFGPKAAHQSLVRRAQREG